jgi:glycosyltransferase involved in cell wall biosynthesis
MTIESCPEPDGENTGPRVLLCTEGTYPFVMGGVSTWCDLLLEGLPRIQWELFALTAGKVDKPQFELPANARLSVHVHLWGALPSDARGSGDHTGRTRMPQAAANLVEGLLGWSGDPYSVINTLAWCRSNPRSVTETFRAAESWELYLEALSGVLTRREAGVGRTPEIDLKTAIELYQTILWVARTGSVRTPPADVSLVTAAGWAALPAVIDKALHNVPMVLAEHGLYVRESYLGAIRSSDSAATRFVSTRLARGLTRVAYAAADVVAPVAQSHSAWEEALGVPRNRILTIPNGVPSPAIAQAPPRTQTVVSVGRLDPLKDIQTLLRVSKAVHQRVPGVRVLHYGPVPRGQEAYAESCYRLHEELQLGDAFSFMGPTSDPTGVMREADLVLMTSISEGFPMSVLEALSQARPVVTTSVGGVLDAMRGAGMTAPPGDVYGLADAVTTLLLDEELAERLGRRGHARVSRLFAQSRCLASYDFLLRAVAAPEASADPLAPHEVRPVAAVPLLAPVVTAARVAHEAGAGVGVAARKALVSAAAPGRGSWLSSRRYSTKAIPEVGLPWSSAGQRQSRDRRMVLVALVATVLVAAGSMLVARDANRDFAGVGADSAAFEASAVLPGLGRAMATSDVSFKSDLSVRASLQVRLDTPVREVTFSVPDTREVAGGEFAPRVSNIRISLEQGRDIPVRDVLTPGAILEVDLPAATTRFQVIYRADEAIVRSKPSTTGRAAALATPLQVRTPAAMTTTLRLQGSSVLNMGCSLPSGAAEACGRTSTDGGWTVTHGPEEQDVAVLAQLDLHG